MINLIVVFYFLVIIFIGIYSRIQIKNPLDYYVAGRKGGVWQVTGSLIATILGGSAILGTLELSQQNGWAAVWFLGCASIGLLFLAPISKYVKQYGNFTLPELIGNFFGSKAEIISSIIIPLAWLGIIAAQISGAAMILNSIGIEGFAKAAIISATVFIVYTLLGGQKSILKTDLLQSILILLVFVIIFFFEVNQTYTIELHDISDNLFNFRFSVVDLIILFLTYSTTFIVGPDIYSRIFCADSEKTAIRSVIITAIILLPFAFIITFLGLATPSEGNGITGFIMYWQQHLPVWISGLLTAALLSAVMSSADTTLLTASMIVSKVFFGPLEKNKSYKATKIAVILIGIFSLLVSIFISSVIQSLLISLSFFSGAFIVPVIAGLLKLRTNKKTVIYAIITGGLIALSGKILSIYYHEGLGNILIITSFIINGLILAIPSGKKKQPK